MDKKFVVLLLLIALIIVATQIYSDDSSNKTNQDKIVWHSLDEGLKLASQNNKHVFIDFMADWCGWCKKMDKDVYTKQEIIELLNNDFIAVRINGDSDDKLSFKGKSVSQLNLARSEFGVSGFPTLWFLRPDGSKLTLLQGYQSADFLQEALIFIKDYKYDSTHTQ